MRRRAFQVFLLLSSLLLAGCGGKSTSSSPAAPGSPSPSTILAQPTAPLSIYIGSTDGTISALNAASGAVRWRAQIADASATTVAALAEGVVYVSATDAGKYTPRNTLLYAFSASDGSVLWHKTLASTGTVAAVIKGAVYLALGGDDSTPSQHNEIQLLRTQDGSELWRTQVAGTGPIQASAYNGAIYVTSFNTLFPTTAGYFYDSTFVYALNASTGAVYWHDQLSMNNYVVAVANGQVYVVNTGTDVVCDPHMLLVLNASDGSGRWQVQGSFLTFIGVEQEVAYVTDMPEGCGDRTYDHRSLYALNAGDGSKGWQIDQQSGYGGALLANGAIYLPVNGALVAYSSRNGSLLWRVQGESGRVQVFNGVLYTSIAGLGLDALNPATGALQWRYQTTDLVSLSGVANGILYGVVTHQTTSSSLDHEILALSAGEGKLLWRFEIGTSEDSPIVG